MENFNKFEVSVKKLGAQNILAYTFEIATIIVETEGLSCQQKQEAYDIAYCEFENYYYVTLRADIFARAAIETVLDEKYPEFQRGAEYWNIHDLFLDKSSALLKRK